MAGFFFRLGHLRLRPSLSMFYSGARSSTRALPSPYISPIWGRHASCITYRIIGIWLLSEAFLKISRSFGGCMPAA